ncbi:hypothetical protein SAMN05518849_101294 [Sphingobium sp. AP50]|uniref:hypothetical protein n=1 Tax=Sphingobium sp. AP50 TaxID=1884369 RepID=UPI0008D6AC5B|nr:hypothetical protein [Sphingobium sp. AP50]SEI61563.1 hypothetical protein SAMN05518849_101294 [Sphingobium sp. AP50]
MLALHKVAKYLLLLSYVGLLASLGLQSLDGPLMGNWSLVLLSTSVFSLAFICEGYVGRQKK